MPAKARRTNRRGIEDAAASSPQDEVEAFQAGNGADMPIFANILPNPMTISTAQATPLPPGAPDELGLQERRAARFAPGTEAGGRGIPRTILEEHA